MRKWIINLLLEIAIRCQELAGGMSDKYDTDTLPCGCCACCGCSCHNYDDTDNETFEEEVNE